MPSRQPAAGLPFCGARVFPERREMVLPDGTAVALRARDLDIILPLHARLGEAVPRAKLTAHWGEAAAGRSADQYVTHLRRLLRDHGGAPELLRSVHGLGWVLLPSPSQPPRARSTLPA